jgi:branched-chain amino acid transport system ATP-binding protein
MPPEAILELRGVRASYGRIEVLRGVDLAIPRRCVVALLGPNGAGKTTLMKVASGQHPADSGCVHLAGRHVNGTRADELSRLGVCVIPEGRGIFPNLTVIENLGMITYSGASASDVRERAFEVFPALAERREQVAGTLSGGEQQMLALARAIASEPTLLMLDEISMGLAPSIVRRLYDIVAGLASGGISILLVEQYARMALQVADFAAIMSQGRIRSVGQPADVADELSSAYLGART